MNVAMSEKLVCCDRGLFVDLLALALTNRGRTRRKMDLPRALLCLAVLTYQVLTVGPRNDWFAIPGAIDSRLLRYRRRFPLCELQGSIYLAMKLSPAPPLCLS